MRYGVWGMTLSMAVLSLSACGTASHQTTDTAGSTKASKSITSPASPTKTAASSQPVTACAASALQITIVHTGAAAGTIGGVIRFANHSASPCSLHGWPTVVGVTAAGVRSVPAAHVHSTMFGPSVRGVPTITLKPGQAAEAVFTGSDNPGPGQTA